MPPMKTIILASQSPRRKDLLTQMGVTFETVPSNFEEHLDSSRNPQEVAIELGLGKAQDVAKHHPNAFVIGSDTIVTVNGLQLGKATDIHEARRMLRQLSGTHNEVTTSVVLLHAASSLKLTGSDTTRVYFRPYNPQAIEAYLATNDFLDKAGAYGIQSGAHTLISHIEGAYDTVLGLPTHLLHDFLAQAGISSTTVSPKPPVPQRLPR